MVEWVYLFHDTEFIILHGYARTNIIILVVIIVKTFLPLYPSAFFQLSVEVDTLLGISNQTLNQIYEGRLFSFGSKFLGF